MKLKKSCEFIKEEPVSDAVVAAIEQSLDYHSDRGDDFRADNQIQTAYRRGFESGVNWKDWKEQQIQSILGVKEENLEKILIGFQNRYAHENSGEFPSAIEVARHFFELGMSVSNKQN